MSELKVRKIGNSLGVIFPSDLVKERNIRADETVVVSVAKKGSLSEFFGKFKSKESGQKIKDKLRKGWD